MDATIYYQTRKRLKNMNIKKSEIGVNPFSVKTPENLLAEEVVDLFVPYAEFENLQVSGHQFLNGHRGSGKSMMLRMMSPDTQMLKRDCKLHDLPYFGVYLSIKATELNAPEYAVLENDISGVILSEHVLATKLLSILFTTIRDCYVDKADTLDMPNLKEAVVETVFSRMQYAGWEESLPPLSSDEFNSEINIFKYIINLLDKIHTNTVQYIKRRAFQSEELPYNGPLIGFQDVLLPIVREFTINGILPQAPIYFLLDDADNLTLQQTRVLNTWVSYRATDSISLKISTQLNYKTYKTSSGIKIEAPHDFSAINFTSVHTGSVKERYPKLIADIVNKRLARHGIKGIDVYDFFPYDAKQYQGVKDIEEEYRLKWEKGESGSYRAGDDAYRYARPEYIRRMSGSSKQGARYLYAGFQQLVHISSGIIRFFLEPASRMFTEQQLINDKAPVISISPSVQNSELRKQADQLLLDDFDELSQEAEMQEKSDILIVNDIERLRHLVQGIGSLFKSHIMDETATQRRVFSFSISGTPSSEVKKILKLGVIHGYFYIDSIGEKSGMGRVTLYVLTRRLAPAFSLDPVGFSGYLSVTSGYLEEIFKNPSAFKARLRKNKASTDLKLQTQLSLLDEE